MMRRIASAMICNDIENFISLHIMALAILRIIVTLYYSLIFRPNTNSLQYCRSLIIPLLRILTKRTCPNSQTSLNGRSQDAAFYMSPLNFLILSHWSHWLSGYTERYY